MQDEQPIFQNVATVSFSIGVTKRFGLNKWRKSSSIRRAAGSEYCLSGILSTETERKPGVYLALCVLI